MNAHVSQGGWPVLVLNADFRPLSYYPLSLWSWQDAIKAVFLDRVNIVEHYDRAVRSPSFEIQLPSVVSLKSFVKPTTHPRGCFRGNRRSRRRCISCIATAGCSRRTICTTAGWIIYTGIPSSIRKVCPRILSLLSAEKCVRQIRSRFRSRTCPAAARHCPAAG